MTVLNPTKDTGATSKASPLLYGEPDRLVTDELLAEQLQIDGVNAPFLADLLSAFVTHERCGRHLYRSVAGRTNNSMLKQRYEHFGKETEEHVEILETLITNSGGSPSYSSPMARAVEAQDAKLLESTFLGAGTLDLMTAEMAMLDAVFAAEALDQANWQAMDQICESLPGGPIQEQFRTAVDRVLSQEQEHFEWAHGTRAKLTKLQLESSTLAMAGEKMEEMMAKVRSWFSSD
ncbi:MAG TPA: hypothetical protein VGL60_08265 [Acidimicrobiales bacterium]|jgi:rubrerythrin